MSRNAIEWGVLLASVASIVLLVGVLVAEGIAERRPADPEVMLQAEQGRQGELGWIVPATVSNAGDVAAEAVILEARAEVGGERETSMLEIDFLPAGTSVEIAFGFGARPSGPVEVRLIGYRVP